MYNGTNTGVKHPWQIQLHLMSHLHAHHGIASEASVLDRSSESHLQATGTDTSQSFARSCSDMSKGDFRQICPKLRRVDLTGTPSVVTRGELARTRIHLNDAFGSGFFAATYKYK